MTSLITIGAQRVIDEFDRVLVGDSSSDSAEATSTLWDQTEGAIEYLFGLVATQQGHIRNDGGSYMLPRVIQRIDTAFERIRLNPFAGNRDRYRQMAFHVELLQWLKYGGPEAFIMHALLRKVPADAQVGPVTRTDFAHFADEPELLKNVSDETFERLLADRLSAMGFNVQMVGPTNRKDGGIDIIAWPKQESPFPFLIACQAKHHRKDRKTPVGDIRDFYGAITSTGTQFNLGIIATNTHFTADAQWFAANNSALLRLRDIDDMCNWFRGDFVTERNWREIPKSIEVASGVTIEIPPQDLWLPARETAEQQKNAPELPAGSNLKSTSLAATR